MAPEPLWKRALEARREEAAFADRTRGQRLQESIRERQAAGKPWGRFRENPVPKLGDVFGCLRVTGPGTRGRLGRADLTFPVQCTTCGNAGVAFEYNLRRLPACSGRGWHRRQA